MQDLIKEGKIQAGHDIGSGGLITTLLEMCFADVNLAADFDLSNLNENDTVKVLFSENIGIVFQADASVETVLAQNNISFFNIGKVKDGNTVTIKNGSQNLSVDVAEARDTWYKTSYLLDKKQSGELKAKERFENYKKQPLQFKFPEHLQEKTGN